MGTNWHAIVVDDRQGQEVKELLESSKSFEDDSIRVTVFADFNDALEQIEHHRFDFIVLDLKDDSMDLPDEESLRGKLVFSKLQATRFAPVIFYTAFPKRVDVNPTAFVKIVERGDIIGLEDAVSSILATKLIHLSRHIEDQKRKYMWEFVEENWTTFESEQDMRGELAYSLARRLSDSLKKSAINFFSSQRLLSRDGIVHAVEMYIVPPSEFPILQAADIVLESGGALYLVLTPTCDLVPKNGKCHAEYVLLAKCLKLEDEPEFIKVIEGCSTPPVSKTAKTALIDVMRNNRKGQPARFFFLPSILGIFPDLIVDFQQLSCVNREDFKFERLASLDSPFSELVVQRLSYFLGRIGTPDLDTEQIYDQIYKRISKKDQSTENVSSSQDDNLI